MSNPARVVGGWLITGDGRISHFEEKEFYRGSNWFNRDSLPKVHEDLVDILEAVREDVQRGVIITSGVRSKVANERVGGDPLSLHLTGGAADFVVAGLVGWDYVPILDRATAGGTIGRWGIYSADDQPHAHVDDDRSRDRRRFIVESGVYTDLEIWIAEHFGSIPISMVDRKKANDILGF